MIIQLYISTHHLSTIPPHAPSSFPCSTQWKQAHILAHVRAAHVWSLMHVHSQQGRRYVQLTKDDVMHMLYLNVRAAPVSSLMYVQLFRPFSSPTCCSCMCMPMLHLNRADTDTSSCMSMPIYISIVPARSLPRFIHHIHSPSFFPSLRILHILHLNPTTATAYIPQLIHPQLTPPLPSLATSVPSRAGTWC